MVKIRTLSDITNGLIDFFKIQLPDADTKPGTVIRDLFIDGPASQLSLIYEELSKVSALQSLRQVSGSDLDKLAKNFGATRKTPTKSSGVALLLFNSVNGAFGVNRGNIVTASNGIQFTILNSISVRQENLNYYRSVATKFQTDLDFLGITDQYAVEVTVESLSPGISGNISKYSIIKTNIPEISNVTNISAFTGGAGQEDDTAFRSRVLSIFSGSNLGTALGYKNLALSISTVLDALIIEPGDELMTRDGTQVSIANDGTRTVISEGSGGKVDIIVLGTLLSEVTDSYIYRDKSNLNDPTNTKNDFVLGQIEGDENKSVTRRRYENLKNGTIPTQPIDGILEVSGSSSGSNFTPKSVDGYGRVSGNYELVKDTGVYSGSPWAFDTFKWTDNKVSDYFEDRIKSKFNGQDTLTFSDALEISNVEQNISIINENSLVDSTDKSLIHLLHSPSNSVTRVFNVNTGERYVVSDQNLNDDGINTTGIIQITGNTLPGANDVLQVDYNWINNFDQYSDFDGLSKTNNIREATDVVDWGYCNQVKKEIVTLSRDLNNNFFSTLTSHQINSVSSVNIFKEVDTKVELLLSGDYAGKYAARLIALPANVTSVESVLFKHTNHELYNIGLDETFFTTRYVIGLSTVVYDLTVIFSTNSPVAANDFVSIRFDSSNIFTSGSSSGTFINNRLTVPVSHYTTTVNNFLAEVNYISNEQTALSTSLLNTPSSRRGNGYYIANNAGFLNSFVNQSIVKENQTIAQDLFLNYYVDLNLSTSENYIDVNSIFAVVRISDSVELWNELVPGTITIVANKYRLVFTSYGTPAVNDQVLVIYYPFEINKSQASSFKPNLIRRNYQSLSYSILDNQYSLLTNIFVNSIGVSFTIIDKVTDDVYGSGTGDITYGSPTTFTSAFDFSTIDNIGHKKISIIDLTNPNNTGIFDIEYVSAFVLNISNDLEQIDNSQVLAIRLLDSKDYFNSNSSISFAGNQINLDTSNNNLLDPLDKFIVLYFENAQLKNNASKLQLSIADQITNSGSIVLQGNTIIKLNDIVFQAVNNGSTQNISSALRTYLGLSSIDPIDSSYKLVKVIKLENVEVTTNNIVLLSNKEYNTFNSKLNDNSYYNLDHLQDTSISDLEFSLSYEEDISIGDYLRITCYVVKVNDTESIFFTKNGTNYTNKKFYTIDKVFISSGFTNSQSANFTMNLFNQPLSSSRYRVYYDYVAPKENERILIRYNYNKLISDVTLSLEDNRPITADVLVKAAEQILVDVTMNVIITNEFLPSKSIIVQNLKDRIIAAINKNILGDIIDASDLVNTAYSVEGIDRATILFFNKADEAGNVLSLIAQKNQYFVSNEITINVESR